MWFAFIKQYHAHTEKCTNPNYTAQWIFTNWTPQVCNIPPNRTSPGPEKPPYLCLDPEDNSYSDFYQHGCVWTVFRIVYKWNHTVWILLCLISFPLQQLFLFLKCICFYCYVLFQFGEHIAVDLSILWLMGIFLIPSLECYEYFCCVHIFWWTQTYFCWVYT